MAQLIDVIRLDEHPILLKYQSPLMIEDHLMMVMDLTDLDLFPTNIPVRGKEMYDFFQKYTIFDNTELHLAFSVDVKDLLSILNESVPCVGCRRSVERLFYQLTEIGEYALHPFQAYENKLMLHPDAVSNPQTLCSLLNKHSQRLTCLVDSQLRNKRSRRCLLHSWDLQKSRLVTPGWKEVWAVMHDKCKEEITLIDFSMLLSKLENYLKKHRFCQDCKTKVMKAYNMLVEENTDGSKEKGFTPALYLGIRRCVRGKHIHLPSNTAYIDKLLERAEPELIGNRRDRHAKTIEIAQEEVLTCIGMCIYDRIHKVYLRLREEEFTCQVLAAVGVEAFVRSFETAVEQKCGVSRLELLCQEITKEEIAKKQRKEMKKLKKKKKKERRSDAKECCECDCKSLDQTDENNTCDCPKVNPPIDENRQKLQILDRKNKGQVKCECEECLEKEGMRKIDKLETDTDLAEDCLSCEDNRVQDYGYSSEPNLPSSNTNSSPDGSEVACSEGFCDHDGECGLENRTLDRAGKTLRLSGPSLAEMLLSGDEDDGDECLIPQEEIKAFQARKVDGKRLELRAMFKNRFAQLCDKAKSSSNLISDSKEEMLLLCTAHKMAVERKKKRKY